MIQPLIVKFSGIVLGFITNILIVKILGISNSGIYYFLSSLITFIIPIGCLGLNNYLLKYTSSTLWNYEDKDNEYFYVCFLVLIWTLIIVSILYVISYNHQIIGFFFDVKNIIPFQIIIINIIPLVLSEIISRKYQSMNRQVMSMLVSGCYQQYLLFCGLFICYFIGYKLTIIELCYIYTAINISVLFFVIYRGTWCKIKNITPGFFYKTLNILKSSFSYMLIHFLSVINITLPMILVGKYCDSVDVTYYSLSYKIAAILGVFYVIANRIVSPEIVKYNDVSHDSLKKIVLKTSRNMFLFSVSFLTIIIILGKEILFIINGDLVNAYNILILLTVSQAINAIFTISGTVLTLTGSNEIQLKISILSTILATIYGIIYIPVIGAVGAAYMNLIFILIISLLSSYQLHKKLKINILKLFS